MKRKINESDVDLRGRVRRYPAEDTVPLVLALFVDGPLKGQTRNVPRGADYVSVGPFHYSYAGKQPDNKRPLYAQVLKSRAERKLLRFVIEKTGRDARVTRSENKPTPIKRSEPAKHGQGARRRAEAHNGR